MSNCSEQYSYWSTSEFMSLAFHVLTIIEIPTHIFVGYVIVFKTPSRMGNVKWYMFNVHLWSAILDISFTFLVTPYFIFPATAGYSLGVFIWFGLNPAIQDLPTLRCFYTGPVFVFTLDSTVVARVTMFKLIVEFTYLGILVYLTFRSLMNQTKHAALSKNTLALQKKFFSSIIIQTVIPFAIIILPIAYCGYSMSSLKYNQTFNNIAFIIISSHGLISTIAILLIHEPYRKTLFGSCQMKNRVTATSSTATQPNLSARDTIRSARPT
uniref:Serpentine Receptor, class H n=1 Tax=Caenorhabditis tropicalis TaxID=1561998 RepID=A0A1I7TXQ4_9PELO